MHWQSSTTVTGLGLDAASRWPLWSAEIVEKNMPWALMAAARLIVSMNGWRRQDTEVHSGGGEEVFHLVRHLEVAAVDAGATAESGNDDDTLDAQWPMP